jgi:hypothetical protein
MNRIQTQVIQWGRRVRDFLIGNDIKSDVAELTGLRQELDDVLGQLTASAAAQSAITKQSRVQTTEIRRLRSVLRDKHLKPIVRMSRTMKLEINGTNITFVLPDFRVNLERLAQAADAMVTALKVVGPQFVARGFAADFVEQLSTATKALRDAVDQRSAQFSRRTGATAAMEEQESRLVQLVRVIDPLVRPVIQNNAELLATWSNVVALPRLPKQAAGVVPTSAPAAPAPTAASTTPATPPTVSGETAHPQQTAA